MHLPMTKPTDDDSQPAPSAPPSAQKSASRCCATPI